MLAHRAQRAKLDHQNALRLKSGQGVSGEIRQGVGDRANLKAQSALGRAPAAGGQESVALKVVKREHDASF